MDAFINLYQQVYWDIPIKFISGTYRVVGFWGMIFILVFKVILEADLLDSKRVWGLAVNFESFIQKFQNAS